MKNTIKYLLLLLFFLFSSYYTNNVINIYKDKDIIMRQIKENDYKYNVEAVNAVINDDTIIPGIEGVVVDYQKSYNQMKKYGSYNEALTRIKKISPTISINNNYDYYIERGNANKREVSLVFIVNKEFPNKIINIINSKNILTTFFIDGNIIENNVNNIKNNSNHKFEILNYDNKYNYSFMKTSMSYLEGITGRRCLFCLTEISNSKLLKYCRVNNLHTIKPIYVFDNNIYHNIKNSLSNGNIYVFRINNYVEKELPVVIDYINSKGYKIISLEELLNEKK